MNTILTFAGDHPIVFILTLLILGDVLMEIFRAPFKSKK